MAQAPAIAAPEKPSPGPKRSRGLLTVVVWGLALVLVASLVWAVPAARRSRASADQIETLEGSLANAQLVRASLDEWAIRTQDLLGAARARQAELELAAETSLQELKAVRKRIERLEERLAAMRAAAAPGSSSAGAGALRPISPRPFSPPSWYIDPDPYDPYDDYDD